MVKGINLNTTITQIDQTDATVANQINDLIGENSAAIVLRFADNGKLPGKATMRVKADYALQEYLGTTGLYVYYWDETNQTMVPIASNVSVDENNDILFEIEHCSYYVIKRGNEDRVKEYISDEKGTDVPEGYVMMFRLYNPNSGEHFYTKSLKEGNSLIDAGWRNEGFGWIAPMTGKPVYRLYNENAGDHHYTLSMRERDSLIAVGWKDEGIGWYSAESGMPLYRLYNPNAVSGSHHYTTSSHERDNLVKNGWRYEGIAWYGK